jgi:predicted TIM-barrel fold metal-dependent hydrolase
VIFDSHTHIGYYPGFNVGLDRDGMAAMMQENDLTEVCIFAPDNHEVQRCVESIDGAHGLVWANPRLPGNIEESIALLDEPAFIGVKMHPLLDGYHPNDPALRPLMEVVSARRLPVLVHTGHPIFSLPWSVEELAAEYPDAKIVFGHMGHGNVIYINASIDIACRRPNVYLETSGMPMHTKIREAMERVGPTRVMYGSDAPFHHPAVEILKVRLSGLDDEGIERVLHSNAMELFLPEKAAAPA